MIENIPFGDIIAQVSLYFLFAGPVFRNWLFHEFLGCDLYHSLNIFVVTWLVTLIDSLQQSDLFLQERQDTSQMRCGTEGQ